MISLSLLHLNSALPLTVSLLMLFSIAYLALLVYHDYQDFLSLGPGGTPSNISGYLRIKFLSFFKLKDPFQPVIESQPMQPRSNYLLTLPKRQSPRPAVRGIAPHRQMNQKSSPQVFSILSAKIKGLASAPQNQLGIGTSCFEQHSTGLFSLSPAFPTCGGEVCHAHASDGSMHMTLHPSDAAVVLARGWGERHPLARGGWLSRFVPLNFIMVYAPRDPAEVDIVMKTVFAACNWVGGRQLSQIKPNDPQNDGYFSNEEVTVKKTMMAAMKVF